MNTRNATLKVLICDDTAGYGIHIASKLNENNIYAYTRRNEESIILDAISKDNPDVVITDLTLKDTDAAEIMRKVNVKGNGAPQFIVISEFANSFIERQLIESGAAYTLSKPFDCADLPEIIKLIAFKKHNDECDDAELLVTNLIRNIGIPAHIKGYRYIRTAILECAADHSYLESITKQLYPHVAEIYKTTPERVERAIRHAIEMAWNRTDHKAISEFFGCSSINFGSRPTNSEFIALASDKLVMHMKRVTSGMNPVITAESFSNVCL